VNGIVHEHWSGLTEAQRGKLPLKGARGLFRRMGWWHEIVLAENQFVVHRFTLSIRMKKKTWLGVVVGGGP